MTAGKVGRPATGQVPPAEQRKRELSRLARAGGWSMTVRITPVAAKAMVEIKKRTGAKSLNAVVNMALVAFRQRKVTVVEVRPKRAPKAKPTA